VESVYLKTLVEVVRTGSISRAADTLCVTQPAVSRRIKFMEDQYGCPLLDRTGPKLTPTEAGRLVYDKAEALLQVEADLMAGLHLLGGRTRISFSSTPAFGAAHLPAILREFMLTCADTADLRFVFHMPGEIHKGLAEGRYDLAVTEMCDRLDLSSYVSLPLPDAEVLFVSAPTLRLRGPDTPIETLFEVPLFTRREGCCSRTLLDENLAAIGHHIRDFRKVIVFDDLHVVVQAVLDGEGVSFLSRDVVTEHLTSDRMRHHRIAGFQHTRRRAVVLNRSDYREGPLGQFVSALFDHFHLPVPADAGLSRQAPGAPVLISTYAKPKRVGRHAAPRRVKRRA
jgi:DNA-binding transcriptional LysR family regulator